MELSRPEPPAESSGIDDLWDTLVELFGPDNARELVRLEADRRKAVIYQGVGSRLMRESQTWKDWWWAVKFTWKAKIAGRTVRREAGRILPLEAPR